MELSWEEKRIQALFSDLHLADSQIAPGFATTWNRALTAPRRRRAFNPAFVAVTALLVCALVSLAVWSKYSQRTEQPVVKVLAPSPAPTLPLVVNTGGSGEIPKPESDLVKKRSRTIRLAAQRKALLAAKLTREARAITSWQSPTSALLSSPSDEVFSSLPQLNQSASDLRSFLPSRSN
jgi:hypothetical protein